MKHAEKVKKFVKCIRSCESANAASSMAHAKYGLNAAWCEDEAAWIEANDLCGWPFSSECGEYDE